MAWCPLGQEYEVLSSSDLEPGAKEGWFLKEMRGWPRLPAPSRVPSLFAAGWESNTEVRLRPGSAALATVLGGEGQGQKLSGIPCGRNGGSAAAAQSASGIPLLSLPVWPRHFHSLFHLGLSSSTSPCAGRGLLRESRRPHRRPFRPPTVLPCSTLVSYGSFTPVFAVGCAWRGLLQ